MTAPKIWRIFISRICEAGWLFCYLKIDVIQRFGRGDAVGGRQAGYWAPLKHLAVRNNGPSGTMASPRRSRRNLVSERTMGWRNSTKLERVSTRKLGVFSKLYSMGINDELTKF